MSLEEIVNAHITENMKKYKDRCFKLFKGRDQAEDLFSMFYLKMREHTEEKVLEYYSKGELTNLCYGTINSLFKNRNRKDSPLLERKFHTELKEWHVKPEENEIDEELFKLAIDSVTRKIETEKDNPHIKTFLQGQVVTIKQIAQSLNAGYYSTARSYHKGKVILREGIEQDKQKHSLNI